MADLQRYDDWLAWLRAWAAADPDVRVAWVGGSAATGGYDVHSDLDVEVLCEPGTSTGIHDRMVAAARTDFEVDHVWALPKTTYPDGRQSFLHLQPDAGSLAEPTRIVDLHVSDLADVHRLVDTRRHGPPIVLHDPDGLVEHRPDSDLEMVRAIALGADQARQRRGTAGWLVSRAIARGDDVEAAEFHLHFAVTPLVRLLRIEHCPWRHDFGLRYLGRDLPDGMAARVADLLPGPDLARRAADTFAWQDELLAMPPLRGLASAGRVVLATPVTNTDAVRDVLASPQVLDRWLGDAVGEISTREPGRLVIGWQTDGPRPSTVTFTLDDLLVVEHDGLADGDPASYASDWERRLDQLTTLVSGPPVAGIRDRYDDVRARYLARGSGFESGPA